MSAAVATLQWELPWTSSADRRKFRNTLAICMGAVLILGTLMPMVHVPPILREHVKSAPPALAQIMLEKPQVVLPPPPPPPPPPPEVKREPLPQPELKQPAPEVKKPIAAPIQRVKPEATVADARQKAAVSGLLQFKDSFADMRDAVDVATLSETGAPTSRGSGEAATMDRSLLTSKHGSRSAGVNVAALSRATGGVALSAREVTKVEVPPELVQVDDPDKPATVNNDPRGRSIEDIRRVFDSNKGAIFAIYNRALRADPSLQGQVVLELSIDAEGRVLDCRVVSTELRDDNLMAKIVSRVRLFDFGKRDVGATTITYPVQFLPT
ncbi:MAG TPA: AgmX/PglI C-terminal domain-containing protein [Pseudomonadales bacterium]